jgi:hypothetical protein
MDAVLRAGTFRLACLMDGLPTLIGGAMILAFLLTVYSILLAIILVAIGAAHVFSRWIWIMKPCK